MTLNVRILAHQFLIACGKILLKLRLMITKGSKIKLIKLILKNMEKMLSH